MIVKFGLISLTLVILASAEDDKKWVWQDNQSRGRDGNTAAQARYEVFEGDRPGFQRPDFNGPLGFNNQRPLIGGSGGNGGGGFGNRPIGLQNQRPGIYGQGQYYPNDNDRGILTGPVPSWIKEGPYKNFDQCKCTERFNCNSPGISYGHCDVGKKYCCFATKKVDQIGGPLPSRPIHSPENGVLVGPGGPVDGPGGPIAGPIRPGVGIGGGGGNYYPRPGGFGGRPIGGGGPGGIGLRPGNGRPGFGINRPIHSPDNGILVGPGGPYDVGGYGNYGRSNNKNNN